MGARKRSARRLRASGLGTARRCHERLQRWAPHGADTFQKYYTQDELRAWIDGTLNTRSVAAAPGIFYVFRHQDAAQRLLANQTAAHDPAGRESPS